MFGHEAVAKDWHRDFDAGVSQPLEKGGLLAVFKEDLTAIIAAMENVIAFFSLEGVVPVAKKVEQPGVDSYNRR